jgi:hypothetical protein
MLTGHFNKPTVCQRDILLDINRHPRDMDNFPALTAYRWHHGVIWPIYIRIITEKEIIIETLIGQRIVSGTGFSEGGDKDWELFHIIIGEEYGTPRILHHVKVKDDMV